jgi:hypothetical protein
MTATLPFQASDTLREATDGRLETSVDELIEHSGLKPSPGFGGRVGLALLPLVLFGAVVGAGVVVAYLSGTGRLR